MKRIMLALTAMMCVFSLFSCLVVPGGGNTGENKVKNDGVVYSPEVEVAIVRSADNEEDYVAAQAAALRTRLLELGITPKLKSDTASADCSEIAIGETTREASVYAYGKMREVYKDGNVTYVILYKNGALAVGAMNEFSFGEAMSLLLEEYVSSGSLKVATDLEIFVNMTEEEYAASRLESNIAAQVDGWEDRWDEATAILGETNVDMLKNLYDCFGEDVYSWLAGLYDTETGAFYYAESSLAYEGFKPDVESTCQALKIIYNSGMVDAYGSSIGPALSAAIPKDMQADIVAFVQSLESEADGYFYHTQWGENIADDRKGRDLQWSLQILDWFGAEPLYPSAIDRISQSATEAVSKVIATAEHPDRFGSPENFVAYLDDVMDPNGDGVITAKESYNSGHKVASQSEQIKAAGLLDVCCDYFDTLQKTIYDRQTAAGQTPSGLWSDEVSYNAISGFFKISVLYSTAKRGINYIDNVVESAMACILSDEAAEQVVFVYNPWAALGEAISGAKNANKIAEKAGTALPYDMEKLYAKVRAKLPQLLSKTIQKLAVFKKADGGFSYNMDQSAPKIQGVYASLGLPEGDVNATTLLCSYMINYIWNSVGVDKVDLWSAKDFDNFMDIVNGNGEIVKIPGETEYTESFDETEEGEVPFKITADVGANVFVTSDGESGNKYLRMDSEANHADGYKIIPRFMNSASCFSFEADIRVPEKSTGYAHQISFYSNTGRLYMIALKGSSKTVSICDASDVSGSGIITGTTGVSFPVDEWFTLGVEIYNEEEFHAKIYVNGACVYISENFFGNKEDGSGAPTTGTVNTVWFYTMMGPTAKLDLDNVKMSISDKVYTDADLDSSTEVTYDFEKYDYKVGGAISSTDAVNERITDPTGENNTTVYHIGKTGVNMWDAYTFKMPTEKSDTITLSMDIYINSLGGTVQLAMGEMDNNCAYMLTMVASGGNFTLSESSSNLGGDHRVTNQIGSFATKQWYTLTITMTVTDDPEQFEAQITFGDTEYTSTLPFNLDGTWEEVNTELKSLYIRANKATTMDLYIDNIVIAYE